MEDKNYKTSKKNDDLLIMSDDEDEIFKMRKIGGKKKIEVTLPPVPLKSDDIMPFFPPPPPPENLPPIKNPSEFLILPDPPPEPPPILISQDAQKPTPPSVPPNSVKLLHTRRYKILQPPDLIIPSKRMKINQISNSDEEFKCQQCNIIFQNHFDLSNHSFFIHNMDDKIKKNNDRWSDDDWDNGNWDNDGWNDNPFLTNSGMVSCNSYKMVFNGEDLNNHKCINERGQDTIIDNIPVDPYGKFECPICKRRYITAFMMGEHFTISHNNYNELGTLDKKTAKGGFPGFDILTHISMIKELSPDNINKIINKKKRCLICCINFKYRNEEVVISEYSSDEEYSLDSEDEFEYANNIKRFPLVLQCCKHLICYQCLRKHIETSNGLECPFCRKDHCRTDLDYIVIVEPTDKCDDHKWRKWWRHHLEIFD